MAFNRANVPLSPLLPTPCLTKGFGRTVNFFHAIFAVCIIVGKISLRQLVSTSTPLPSRHPSPRPSFGACCRIRARILCHCTGANVSSLIVELKCRDTFSNWSSPGTFSSCVVDAVVESRRHYKLSYRHCPPSRARGREVALYEDDATFLRGGAIEDVEVI